MDCTTAKSKIENTFQEVSELTRKQQKEKIIKEQSINKFLDKILDFQQHINEKTASINFVNTKFHEFTWFKDVDEECLEAIKRVLDISNQWHAKLIRYYVELNWIRKAGFTNEAMEKFKTAIDNLKEYNANLYDLFFVFRYDQDMDDVVKQLEYL